jgi:predicted Zn-dependent peptidase
MALVGAGRIDFDRLVADAQRASATWAPTRVARQMTAARAHRGFLCLEKDTATLEYMLQLAAGPAATDPDRYAAKILATILGDDTGSRLYWALVDSGLAEHASLGHHDYLDAGVLMTYMSCEPQYAQGNIERIAGVYREAEADGVTDAELSQAKSKINSRVVLASERPRGRLFTVGGNWIQRREYRTVHDDLQAIDAVTVDDIRRVLKRFPLSTNTTLAIGPAAGLKQPA